MAITLIPSLSIGEVTTTSGTGTYAISGKEITRYFPFTGFLTNGQTSYFEISDGVQLEWISGTYTGTAISRDSVLNSSTGGAAINWPSTGQRFIRLASASETTHGAMPLGFVLAGTSGQIGQYTATGNAVSGATVSGHATMAVGGAITLANTTVTPGSYTATDLTVDAQGRITAAASGTGSLTSTLTSGYLFIGNASNVATGVAASGDLVVSNTGAFTVNTLVGDSGAGGVKGLVPAPASGDAAAYRFLMANGSWLASWEIESLTIASGVVTVTSPITRIVTVDTEGGASSDDLDTINGLSEGQTIWVRTNNSARDVNLRDGSISGGNIFLHGAASVTLGVASVTMPLVKLPSNAVIPQSPILTLANDTSGTLAVSRGGTGAVTLGAGLPLLGAGTSAITTGTLSGNTTKLATTSGTLTSTHLAVWDANSNLVDGGAPSAGGLSTTLTSAHLYVGNGSNVATDVAITGDVTFSNAGVTAIGTAKVTNAMLADMATHTFKGNNTGGTAAPINLTATELTAELNAVVGDSGAGGTKGLVPAPASGDAAAYKFLMAGGSWQSPWGIESLTIASGAITVVSPNTRMVTVDTEGGAASDDLDTINGLSSGQVIWLKTANSARDVNIRDSSVGGGNIELNGNATVALVISGSIMPLIKFPTFVGQAVPIINLTSDVSGILPAANGGTANAFFTVAGPATAAKTYTFPNADSTVLTSNAAVTVAQGGTEQTTYTNGQLLIGNTTGNTLAKATLTAGSGVSVTNGAGTITLASLGTESLTISSGAITVTSSTTRLVIIDTEGAAATDDLDTISGLAAGQEITIVTTAGARDVSIRDNSVGGGNIQTLASATQILSDPFDSISFALVGSNVLQTRPLIFGTGATTTNYYAPSTGATLSLGVRRGICEVIVKPAGTLATLTVTLPTAPRDGDSCKIRTTQILTSLTCNGQASETVTGGTGTLAANRAVSFIYRVTDTTWYGEGL